MYIMPGKKANNVMLVILLLVDAVLAEEVEKLLEIVYFICFQAHTSYRLISFLLLLGSTIVQCLLMC